MTFENSKVPIENVIGEVGGGFKVITQNHIEQYYLKQIVLFGSVVFSMLEYHVCVSTDCNEHPEQWEVQHGKCMCRNDQETDWYVQEKQTLKFSH